jgi:hypothetical protein
MIEDVERSRREPSPPGQILTIEPVGIRPGIVVGRDKGCAQGWHEQRTATSVEDQPL